MKQVLSLVCTSTDWHRVGSKNKKEETEMEEEKGLLPPRVFAKMRHVQDTAKYSILRCIPVH